MPEIHFVTHPNLSNIKAVFENAVERGFKTRHKNGLRNIRSALKNTIGDIARNQFSRSASAFVAKLESDDTWHQFGIFDSLDGRNFMYKFWETFYDTSRQNFQITDEGVRATGKGIIAKAGLKYFSKELLTENTMIHETTKIHTVKELRLSWWDEWVMKKVPTEPDHIEKFIFVNMITDNSRTGQGVMMYKDKARKYAKDKRRTKIGPKIMSQIRGGAWRFRITDSQRHSLYNNLRSAKFRDEVRNEAMRAYRLAFK